jgi:DNA/RNA endonuclease YhcR with UshA esterase domain
MRPLLCTPDEAKRHIGEETEVLGVVSRVSTSEDGTTYLNFGPPVPNHDFTALIFRSAASEFPNAADLEGKRVHVFGVVGRYRGKPQVVLETATQLRRAEID